MSYYPPVGYSFLVNFIPNLSSPLSAMALLLNGVDYSFKEVSGLNATISTEPYKEGGVTDMVHNLPSAPTFSNITLKRGLLVGSAFGTWVQMAVENFNIVPMDLLISLLGPDHMPIIAWNVVGAYPIKSEISGFNAMQNELVVESVELACQRHRRIPLSVAGLGIDLSLNISGSLNI